MARELPTNLKKAKCELFHDQNKKILVLTDLSEYARHAPEECIDLIVLTTHGRPGLSHALIGSTAEKIVQMAPCPVLDQ